MSIPLNFTDLLSRQLRHEPARSIDLREGRENGAGLRVQTADSNGEDNTPMYNGGGGPEMRLLFCLLAVTVLALPRAEGVTADAYTSLTQVSDWLNVSRPLTPKDLQGRILLVDFWTFCCINCQHVIPDLQALEREFDGKLTVVGVHSAKFTNEKDRENIRNAIVRYGIEHPVVNDADFLIWNRFSVSGWPHLMLIGPDGQVFREYSGEGHLKELEADISSLIAKHTGAWPVAKLPIALERDKVPTTYLSFPGKLAYVPNYQGSPLLVVSDSGHNRIVGARLDGRAVFTVGAADEGVGFADGDLAAARFNKPQGILYHDGSLFVADTGNHLLRRIDLVAGRVETLAGTGAQGFERSPANGSALKVALNSPWDLALYPSDHELAIAMAGLHQIWAYDLVKKRLRVLAGNGVEAISDGTATWSSLAQTSGLAPLNNGTQAPKLYFVDSESSSLRELQGDRVTTEIGGGLFHFGNQDGNKDTALLQHPLGVYADLTGVYVADSYNHAIRRYDTTTKWLSTLAGGTGRGRRDGSFTEAQFNEPNAIVKGGDKFYVADTNNGLIRVLDPNRHSVETLDIRAPEASHVRQIATALPLVKKAPDAVVKVGVPVKVGLDLAQNWKLNEIAPSWLALFKVEADRSVLVKEFSREELKAGNVAFPELDGKATYRLQGTLYFCGEGPNSLCVLQSHDQKLTAGATGETQLFIHLRPQ